MPSSLDILGWNARLAALAAESDGGLEFGRVARVDRGLITVQTSADDHRRVTSPDGPVAVGDWVGCAAEKATVILERRTALRRQASGDRAEGQLIAANIDIVLICQALPNGPNIRRLERELVIAWESGARPVVALTKADAVDDLADRVALARTVTRDAEVITVSSRHGEGVAEIRGLLQPNHTLVALGASGAGKSTLVNALVGSDVATTGEVREDDQRGRHTTVAGALILVPSGGVYLDTPGIRSVGLWADDDEALVATFDDLEATAARCRFRDCQHDAEPGCAIVAAIEDGTLDYARVESWRRLQHELTTTRTDRPDPRARRSGGRPRPAPPITRDRDD